MTTERLLTTEEVARRLGVKRTTVYAYVSRGLLASRRNADGKESLFAEPDVAAFAATRRRQGATPDAPAIHTGITLITDGDLFYRGHNTRTLATTESYESVTTLLWAGRLEHVPLVADAKVRGLAEAVTAALPPDAQPIDRLRVIVAAIAAADPLRFDTTPAAVTTTGRTILGTMMAALPVRTPHRLPGSPTGGRADAAGAGDALPGRSVLTRLGDAVEAVPDRDADPGLPAPAADQPGGAMPARPDAAAGPSGRTTRTGRGSAQAPSPSRVAAAGLSDRFPFAAALWVRLSDREPAPADIAALNAALILLADHDLAASTFAARVAASTRAHPYAVVGAGLAALDGPLHGAASALAFGLITDAVRAGDALSTIADRLRTDGWVPGFGHDHYPAGDPRAVTLLAALAAPSAGRRKPQARSITTEVAAAMRRHSGAEPNIDFALAAFCLLNGMDASAGEAIFAIARTAGWIAHALEEYADQPSRFRPSGRYAGRPPTDARQRSWQAG
jgi:citrate synthase